MGADKIFTISISKLKIKFQKIIDLIYSNQALYAVVKEEQDELFNKKEKFSLIDDLQMIFTLINKDQDFEVDGWCTEIPLLKNTSVYKRRKSNAYFVGRLRRICMVWTSEHIDNLYEYLRDHPEKDLHAIRSLNVISKCKGVKLRQNKGDEDLNENTKKKKKKEKRNCFFKWTKKDFNIFFQNNFKNLEFDALSINTDPQNNAKNDAISNLLVVSNLEKNFRKITDMPDQNLKDYNNLIQFVSEKYLIKDEKIIKELLEKVNDNRENLIKHLETKDEKLLWTENEDDILRGLKSEDDFVLKLLCSYKGIENVRERQKFKSITLSFNI